MELITLTRHAVAFSIASHVGSAVRRHAATSFAASSFCDLLLIYSCSLSKSSLYFFSMFCCALYIRTSLLKLKLPTDGWRTITELAGELPLEPKDGSRGSDRLLSLTPI